MKKRYGFIIFIISAIVLYLVLKDDYKSILTLLANVNLFWLFASFLLTMSYCYFKTLIMHNIVNKMERFSIFKAFKLQLMTFFFNAVTPFATGGQPFQIYKLNKEGLKLNHATSTIVQETIINQIAVLSAVFIALIINWFLNIYAIDTVLFLFILFGIVANGLVLFIFLLFSINKRAGNKLLRIIVNLLYKIKVVKNKEEKLEKWKSSFVSFSENSKILYKNKFRFLKLITINTLAYLIIYTVPLTVLFSLGDYNSFNGLTAIVLTSIVSLVGSFIPLPGGTGGQEYTFILLFSKYISNPMLSSVMLLWRFITYYVPMIIGAIIFNLQGGKKCE